MPRPLGLVKVIQIGCKRLRLVSLMGSRAPTAPLEVRLHGQAAPKLLGTYLHASLGHQRSFSYFSKRPLTATRSCEQAIDLEVVCLIPRIVVTDGGSDRQRQRAFYPRFWWFMTHSEIPANLQYESIASFYADLIAFSYSFYRKPHRTKRGLVRAFQLSRPCSSW